MTLVEVPSPQTVTYPRMTMKTAADAVHGRARTSPLEDELSADLRGPRADSAPPPTAASPRSLATRRAIMAAARRSFLERGLARTRLAAVARDAWYAPSTVSLHFRGKEALFAACLDEDAAALVSATRQTLDGHPFPAISGDLSIVLGSLLPRFALLESVLVRCPGQWAHVYRESASVTHLGTTIVAEVVRAQGAGLIRDDVSARAAGQLVARQILQPPCDDGAADSGRADAASNAQATVWLTLLQPLDRVHDIQASVRPWRRAHPLLRLEQRSERTLRRLGYEAGVLGRDIAGMSAPRRLTPHTAGD